MSVTSSTYIETVPFQKRHGVVLLPQKDTAMFSSPTAQHVGAQVSPAKGPPFQLMLTKYTDIANRLSLKAYINSLNGQVVRLTIDGVNYSLPQYGSWKFIVSHARVVGDENIPHVCGYHDGVAFEYSPAYKMSAQLMLYAVPST